MVSKTNSGVRILCTCRALRRWVLGCGATDAMFGSVCMFLDLCVCVSVCFQTCAPLLCLLLSDLCSTLRACVSLCCQTCVPLFVCMCCQTYVPLFVSMCLLSDLCFTVCAGVSLCCQTCWIACFGRGRKSASPSWTSRGTRGSSPRAPCPACALC